MEGFIYASPLPLVISSYQAKVALMNAGLYNAVVSVINSQSCPAKVKLAWQEGISFEINNPMVKWVAGTLNITSQQLEDLFLAASRVREGEL